MGSISERPDLLCSNAANLRGETRDRGVFRLFHSRSQRSTGFVERCRNWRPEPPLPLRSAGNLKEFVMDRLARQLPERFPVGTRYVVEGSGGSNGRLHIRLRYLEFPDGRQIALPLPGRIGADPARGATARTAPPKK